MATRRAWTTARSASRRPDPAASPLVRAATGALGGGVTAFILSSLAWGGIVPSRVLVCALGAAVGAVVYPRWPRTSWLLLCAAAVVWLLVAFTPVSRYMTAGLVRHDPLPPGVDAVVVLSGSVTEDGMLGPEALDRLLSALELVRAGKSSTLVITQPHPLRDTRITTAADQRQLIAMVPAPPRVLVIDRVVNTHSEALGATGQLPPASTSKIALVTSPLHTRRACAVFEHVGYRVACMPSDSRDIALRTLGSVSDRLAAFRMALSERVAFIVYRQRGWI